MQQGRGELMATAIDFSSRTPRAGDVRKDGHAGAIMYISPARERWMKAKPVDKQDVEAYRSHGLKTAFVWQYGKEKNPDVMRGYNGGVEDARKAQEHLNYLGLPNNPVFFAVDFDISLSQWNSTAVHYFKGVNSVLGKHRTGIYGHSRVVHWAKEDGVIASLGNGRVLGWVTRSWSRGETARDYAVLYQGTHNVTGSSGVKVDINTIYHKEWGWRPLPGEEETMTQGTINGVKPNPNWRGDPTFLPDVLRAFGVEVQEYGDWRNIGHGDFNRIQGVIWHHTGTTKDIPDYIQKHPQLGLCSQVHLSRSGVWQIVGAGIAWHAGVGSYPGWPTNMGNQVAIGIEAASDGIAPWSHKQLDSYRKGTAAILWFLGKNATPQTMLAHGEYAGREQGKWDPGAGFGVSGRLMDMNRERAEVQKYIDQANAGSLNREEDEMTPHEKKLLQNISNKTNQISKDMSKLSWRVEVIEDQLLGPNQYKRERWGWETNPNGGRGWKQLGSDRKGIWLTLVDSVADIRQKISHLEEDIKDIKNKRSK